MTGPVKDMPEGAFYDFSVAITNKVMERNPVRAITGVAGELCLMVDTVRAHGYVGKVRLERVQVCDVEVPESDGTAPGVQWTFRAARGDGDSTRT